MLLNNADNSEESFQTTAMDKVFSDQKVESLEVHINPTLIKNLTQFMKIDKLTNVQAKSLVPFLNGNNMLIKSETGSGKTLSYVIPLVQMLFDLSIKLKKIQRSDGTFAIILAPTRELCIQIEKVVKQVSVPYPWIVTGTVMGGEKKKAEKEKLRKGVTILIATPGRLEDHLKTTSSFKYDNLKYVILDEADRLLDLGFEKTINGIFDILNKKVKQQTQKVLLSATLHAKIKNLATGIGLTNAVYVNEEDEQVNEKSVNLKEEQLSSSVFTIPAGISQYYILAPCKLRLSLLASFLKWKTYETQDNKKKSKIVVFLSCCDSVEYHYSLFSNIFLKKLQKVDTQDISNGSQAGKMRVVQKPFFEVPLFKLYGDMPQKDRTKVYFDFCKTESGILLCTDVAARGLDLPAVDWIVQFDAPGTPKEYLHRIGRTARLGMKGNAVIFLMPHELPYSKLLEKYNINLQEIPAGKVFNYILKNIETEKMKANNPLEAGSWLQNLFTNITSDKDSLYKKAIAAYQSFIRYYATHARDVKIIFHVNNLHLGHVASSFGLLDKPSKLRSKQESIGATSVAIKKQQKEMEYEKKGKRKEEKTEEIEEMRTRKRRMSSNLPKEDKDNASNMGTSANKKETVKFSLSVAETASIPPPPITKNRLSTAERLQRYKDFTKGKLKRDRPSIIIPEGMFKTSKKQQEQPRITIPTIDALGKGLQRRQQDDMLRNPFNKRERSMIGGGMTSEFDSGFSSSTKARDRKSVV